MLPDNALYNRLWRVTVGTIGENGGTLDVSALDLEFKILRTIKKEPNKATLTLYNVNPDHRAALLKRNKPNKLSGVTVTVEAGYKSTGASLLLSMDMRDAGTTKDGEDYKTIITGDDGGRSFREARFNKQYTTGTSVSQIIKDCADAMGIGTGNVATGANAASIAGLGQNIPHTFTASGSAQSSLDRIVRSAGLRWSVQNGSIQLLKKSTPLNLDALLVSPSTGLIGSPESAVDASVSLGNPQQFAAGAKQKKPPKVKPKDPGIIKFTMLITPGIFPGRKIVMQSEDFNGGYYITEVEFEGSTRDNPWYARCVARIY